MANKAGQIRAAAGQPARSTKATPLVRYPKATNALRALLGEGTSQGSAFDAPRLGSLAIPRTDLAAAEYVRRSAFERSKPSLSAMRLLMGAVRDVDEAHLRPDVSEPRDLPRLEPVVLTDGASLGEMVRIMLCRSWPRRVMTPHTLAPNFMCGFEPTWITHTTVELVSFKWLRPSKHAITLRT